MPLDFTRFGLGMSRARVTLANHNPLWADAFLEVRKFLEVAAPEAEFHHVGSTAIPGIRAKPILDVLCVVADLEALERAARGAWEAAGFEWKGEHGIAGRRYCVLYDLPKENGFVHLHAFARDHAEVKGHLLFRDALRADAALAARYDSLKESLSHSFAGQRARYTEGKAEFIQGVLARALPRA
jgi:GrpB-like predicted nucleotidyltransferase (UPF0157 family)